MKLSKILAQRQALLLQARLANLAHAYRVLSDLAVRIGRARLNGDVTLKQADITAERYWASLLALGFNQSLIEEHFTDEDIMDLADVISFVTGDEELDVTFRLEELPEKFIVPLRLQLEQAGVAIDRESRPVTEPRES